MVQNRCVRTLIIEDDPDIAAGVAKALQRAGYQTETAYDGPSGENLAMMNSYAAIVLDWMLPGKDGRAVCESLRKAGVATPVLMMTARDEVPDRVAGLSSGADDYLGKPFAVEELVARIQALVRRDSANRAGLLEFGGLKLDPNTHCARVDGESVSLTQREFDLLEALMRNPGRVLTRDVILERVFNNDEALPNTVNFHMSSLRKKVDPGARLIQTVHGVGYVLRSPG